MNKDIFTYGALLFLLPILQAGIFNNVNLLGYINPFIYLILIFLYPLKNKVQSLLLISFFLGLFVDILGDDGGIHAFSLVFIAYIRFFILRLITGKSPDDLKENSLSNLPFSSVVIWVILLIFIHHFLIFVLEQFSFNNFGLILSKTLLTTVLSFILIIISLQLFLKKKSNA